jgi:hypothetical protein
VPQKNSKHGGKQKMKNKKHLAIYQLPQVHELLKHFNQVLRNPSKDEPILNISQLSKIIERERKILQELDWIKNKAQTCLDNGDNVDSYKLRPEIDELIKVGKNSLTNHSRIYLTECFGCCSGLSRFNVASYRLLAGIPIFNNRQQKGALHPEKYTGKELIKLYNQPRGYAADIATLISENVRKLGPRDSVPYGAIIYELS